MLFTWKKNGTYRYEYDELSEDDNDHPKTLFLFIINNTQINDYYICCWLEK